MSSNIIRIEQTLILHEVYQFLKYYTATKLLQKWEYLILIQDKHICLKQNTVQKHRNKLLGLFKLFFSIHYSIHLYRIIYLCIIRFLTSVSILHYTFSSQFSSFLISSLHSFFFLSQCTYTCVMFVCFDRLFPSPL